MARVIVLYNTDYDEDPTAAVDATSVESSARSIRDALISAGHTAELVGLKGFEVFDVLVRLRAAAPDLVFNLCESMEGDARNEPTFAGLLDLVGLRYTGADLPALAACLHKRRSKDILLGRGIPTPPHRFLTKASDLEDTVLDGLDYPWFLKLAHEDASIGITEQNLVRNAAELRARAGAMIAEYEQPVLAERYIDGREINVTLIGNGADLTVLPLHEIDFGAMPAGRPRIVSYAAKWDEAHVDYAGTKSVPLRDANAGLVAACERVARAAWDAHGLRDYARVDLRIDSANRPWVIDVNPNPDISPDAGVVRSAAVAGMTYVQLVERITNAALRRPARV
jgi:D-alanine-D-alanine ligase